MTSNRCPGCPTKPPRLVSIYEKAVAPDQSAFRRALERTLGDHAAAKNRAKQQP